MSTVAIGIDIGQKRDPTAICVAETQERAQDKKPSLHFQIRYLERLPLGTPYPGIADRLAKIVSEVENLKGSHPEVYVDATGVGAPVVDLLEEQVHSVIPVFFTHGDRRIEEGRRRKRQIKLGKAFLVSRLQALLQTGRIHLPKTSESQALAKELLDYEIRVDENANDRYGAFRVGTHDDLVTALGLAIQKDERPRVSGIRFVRALQ
ncbi:MAG: hypothetical protein K0U98_05905 [Deltaproteobacteria bacterium]|nr:hypothetical protein [Deltaproteobacteria bacterium]